MKLAIITGGSRGLGKALVEVCRTEGWTVLEFSRSGAGEWHVPLDLGDIEPSFADATAKLEALAAKPWKNVVFVNNAGLLSPVTPARKLGGGAIERNLGVNVVGPIRLISAFMRAFDTVAAKKTIANISSGAALKGYFGWSLYCASKAAMENFVRSLAEEQAGVAHPFACVNIGPGVIDTAMQAEIRGVTKDDFPDVDRFIQYKESGQLRKPEAVARTVFRIVTESPKNGERYNVADYD